MKTSMKVALCLFLCWTGSAFATIASTPSCTFANGALGGTEVTCTNPNTATPTLMCVTLDGTTPESNGSGTACTAGWVLSPVSSGGSEYAGYFNISEAVTVKIRAGVSGETDSTVASYSETPPTNSVQASAFGAQCALANCTGGAFPSSPWPCTFRMWQSHTDWSTTEGVSSGTYDWSGLDEWLNSIANETGCTTPVAIETFGWTPEWACCYGGISESDAGCGKAASFPNGCSAPPEDLTSTGSPNFNSWVTKFVQHCSSTHPSQCVYNLVKVYELYNEWDGGYFWTNCGSTMAVCGELLYQMVAPAAKIIRANVAGAVILTPSSTPASSTYESDFSGWLSYENGSGRISDYPNYHLYLSNPAPPPYNNTPETQWANYGSNFLSKQAGSPGWLATGFVIDETNFIGNNPTYSFACDSGTYDSADCTGQIARWQVINASEGNVSLDWFAWSTTFEGNTSYLNAYTYLQNYLVGGAFSAAASNVSGSVWTAPFTESGGTQAEWAWTTDESGVSISTPTGYVDYRNLSGNTVGPPLPSHITLTTEPIMLEK